MPPKKSKLAAGSAGVPIDYKAAMAQIRAHAAAKKAAEERTRKEESALTPEQRAARQEQEDRQRAARELRERLDERRKQNYERRFAWTFAFWAWLLFVHATGMGLFTSGFLLTRLVLDEKSDCTVLPDTGGIMGLEPWEGIGSVEGGCWYPKTFDRAVVVLIDALRYDFTVPVGAEGRSGNGEGPQIFHNAFPFLYDTAVARPNHAFLRPFIADPPTTTLQRLKALTTGTLPTFIDMGSNFAGTAIEEDNLLMQLRDAGKKIAHLGDDTWEALFPGYFEPNISRAYDSLNVWDLHTVDNGVLEHIFPLMRPERKGEWDLLIGHLLGVDHAGHRYGPDHPAMKAKLEQMDQFIRNLTAQIDDDTLLIVMGDHGMDDKGDHGGESDDEVEAALWMYSARPAFGRTTEQAVTPPPNAKVRRVNQIDLVPTLALLLGIPIPYNNLGRPVEEAFSGRHGTAWDKLAAASHITSAGIKRYMGSYFAARGLDRSSSATSASELWTQAQSLLDAASKSWPDVYAAFSGYQEETLSVCKSLWARFDIPNMVLGIAIMVFGVIVLLLYVSRDADEDLDMAALDDVDLDAAETMLELQEEGGDELPSYQTTTKSLVKALSLTFFPALVLGMGCSLVVGFADWKHALALAVLSSMGSVTVVLLGMGKTFLNLLPSNFWGWLAVVFTVSQSIGFAANSYTIWEDSILLFFLTTFGLANALAAFRLESVTDRSFAIYHSIMFVLLGRVASISKLCREEQMPYCTSTYYASQTSSTSSTWQLFIPIAAAIFLPSIIKGFMNQSRSYEGLAPNWIGWVLRAGLFLVALFWAIDAADNGEWYPNLPPGALKTLSVHLARLILALAFVAGTTAFIWTPPCITVFQSVSPSDPSKKQVAILGYGNVNGARFLLLVINIAGACILLSKPMGGGALAIMLWQVLALVEILDLNGLTTSPIGPVMLGILGNFHFFKTGHQAVLSSIQWDSAFIALFSVRYPWSPFLVALNTFAGQVIAAAAVPLLVMWKVGPKRRGILENVSRSLGGLVAYYAVEATATMAWAGHLRRHLMLYRVFSPRFMMGAVVLLLVDVVGLLVALPGTRTNTLAVGEVFGFAD